MNFLCWLTFMYLSVTDKHIIWSLSFSKWLFCLIFSFEDPGPHGTGRYSENMLPEIEKEDFRKGAQVIYTTTIHRNEIYWIGVQDYCAQVTCYIIAKLLNHKGQSRYSESDKINLTVYTCTYTYAHENSLKLLGHLYRKEINLP